MKKLAQYIAGFIALAFAFPAAAIQDFSALLKNMAQCETSEQCVVVEGICGGDDWTAVNKRTETDYADFVAKIRPTASCSVAQALPKPASAECVNNFCEIK